MNPLVIRIINHTLLTTMFSIKNLIINCVELQYSHHYIADVFWYKNIAQVSSVTLIPYLKNGKVFNIAYITIDEWSDREVAYNFIQRLKNPNNEARFVYNDDNWWSIKINTHNNGDIVVGTYTVEFDEDYYDQLDRRVVGYHLANTTPEPVVAAEGEEEDINL